MWGGSRLSSSMQTTDAKNKRSRRINNSCAGWGSGGGGGALEGQVQRWR